MKKYYATEYLSDNSLTASLYSSYVLASSKEEALNKISMRNLGEELRDSKPISLKNPNISIINAVKLFEEGKYKHCTHAVTFMCFVLCRANKLTYECISDKGIVHEMIHVITSVYDFNIQHILYNELKNKIKVIQELFDEISH